MLWWNPLTWGRADTAALAAAQSGPLDLTEFARSEWGAAGLSLTDVLALGSFGTGCRPDTPAWLVPLEVLDAMGFDPVIYAGERMVTAPACDPDLYYLRGDKKACAEVEAWLRPLLTAQRDPLLNAIVRAFALGAVPIVMTYGTSTLRFEQEAENAKGTITRTITSHTHTVSSHEVWPGHATFAPPLHDRLTRMTDGSTGMTYGAEDHDEPGLARAFLATWDPQFGRLAGQGSRRRAYKDWIEGCLARLWEMRALERVVDPARVGYAPEGNLKVNGQEISAVKLLRSQMMSLRNGSVITLPGTLDANGNPLWRMEVPGTPSNGHEIAKQAISERDVKKLWATLSPGGSADKATEEQFLDTIQGVCDFAASFLTRLVRVNLRLRYGEAAPFVQVLANDLPKRKLRTAAQVFGQVCNATQKLQDGRVYTLAELVDPEIVEQLGIKMRPVADAAREEAAPPAAPGPGPGRPIEPMGDREQRREDARTVEAEDDTSGDDMERDDRELQARIAHDIQALRADNASAAAGIAERVARLEGAASAGQPITINVPQPEVNVAPAEVHYHAAEQPAPVVHVAAPSVTVEAPAAQLAAAPSVVVNVPEQPAPVVHIENVVNVPKPAAKDIRVSFDHGAGGSVTSATGTVTPTE